MSASCEHSELRMSTGVSQSVSQVRGTVWDHLDFMRSSHELSVYQPKGLSLSTTPLPSSLDHTSTLNNSCSNGLSTVTDEFHQTMYLLLARLKRYTNDFHIYEQLDLLQV